MEKILKSVWLGLVLGLLLGFLAVWQEVHLGSARLSASVMGVAVAYFVGVIANLFAYVMGGGFAWKRTLSWLVGGAIGVALVLLVY